MAGQYCHKDLEECVSYDVYKEALTEYLRNFMTSLQRTFLLCCGIQ